METSVKFFRELVDLNQISTIDGGRLTYLASMNYPSNISQEDYYNECIKLGHTFDRYSKLPSYSENNENNENNRKK